MKKQEGEPLAAASMIIPTMESISQLFAEHYRRVLLAAHRITGNMADAEDIAQGLFLRLASTDRPIDNVGSYLHRAAINGALDLLRRRKSAATEPLDQAVEVVSVSRRSSPESEVSSRQLGEALRTAIGELPPRAAEMFALRYFEELGNKEIATMMGTSQAAVAVTLHNTRSRLKKRLLEMDGKINETR
ncbi:RNA polymerase sigma factor [Granulicella pectinivorans]|jgi:RNA polymerase sigma-70 factor (ECF subfamily)|nr:sigma-70 family RNA polymerase sigma factor [Granulicella pectinivorans]